MSGGEGAEGLADGAALAELRAAREQDRAEIAALQERVAALSAALEAGGGGLEASGAEANQAPPAPSDVTALRDALTTIIEQNQQIRAQQEAISARIQPPAASDISAAAQPAPTQPSSQDEPPAQDEAQAETGATSAPDNKRD